MSDIQISCQNFPAQVSSLTKGAGAPSVPALRDTLRGSGPGPLASGLNSSHPVSARVAGWSAAREATRGAIVRRSQGVGAAVVLEMERAAVGASDCGRVFGGRSVHMEVLRDGGVEWEDVYPVGGGGALAEVKMDMHGAIARAMTMDR